ncbi:MAG: ArnT family glycosyltransferase [Planctomycetaceae bacterium]
MPITRSAGLLISALAAIVLLPNLGGPPLWDDDEPRNAACSLAMHASGDWVVPTFNGRLRVEKPALVNWLHLAGFAVAGVNETGARLASAVLTIGTCLLTALIGGLLFRPEVGCWAGIVMATCLWTGIGGRAATPDAALTWCTTLALWLFVRGSGVPLAGRGDWRDGPVAVSRLSAVGIGVACGFAMLAKGPVGLVLPLLAIGGFCWWQAARDPGRAGGLLATMASATSDAIRGLRLPVIAAAAVAVALPWYAGVALRTDGAWPRGFFLVHNLGRLTTTMEGHSGSALLYFPVVLLVGTFPWSMASALVVRHAGRVATTSPAMRLLVSWIAAWVVPFCFSATKLPGYVWPAYPAVAIAVAHFLVAWMERPAPGVDRWMRAAWTCLAASGLGLAIGLPWMATRYAPGAEWLGLIGLVPLAGAAVAWRCQSLCSRIAASSAWAATACCTIGLLLAAGPAALGTAGGTRDLVATLGRPGRPHVPVGLFNAPASAAFYASRATGCGAVHDLAEPAAAAAFVASHPGAHLVVDAHYEEPVTAALPPHYRVVRAATSFPTGRRVLLLGPGPTDSPRRFAADPGAIPSRR